MIWKANCHKNSRKISRIIAKSSIIFNLLKIMLVLGIESSCDEMGCALVRSGKEILSNVLLSQIDLHQKYGGVFPELASRRHLEDLIPTIECALTKAGVSREEIDLIAVAKGPGLIGSLLIGMNAAKALSVAWDKPFVGVSHVEAHLYAAMMQLDVIPFPALGAVISGGHTFLVRILSVGKYELIGTTVDDAIGEAFDKVAALLGLPYPGGPAIEQLALKGDASRYQFKKGRVKENPWNFSFSGLKTNLLYTIKGDNAKRADPSCIDEKEKAHIAAAFQETALSDIVDKTLKAAETFGCKAIFLGGGVSASRRLRKMFEERGSKFPLFFPPQALCLDNAAMIAALGYHVYRAQGEKSDPLDLECLPRLPL